MKYYLRKYFSPESSDWWAFIPPVLSIFVIGSNWNTETIPDSIFYPVIIALALVGLIGYAAFIYWTIYFWSQNSIVNKLLSLIKAFFFTWLFIAITEMVCGIIFMIL